MTPMRDQRDQKRRICGQENPCTCSVEGIVTIDGRGQMVLPKEVRERAGIAPGDRFAVVFSETDGSVCCITLIRKEHLDRSISSLVHPVQEKIRSGECKIIEVNSR